MTIDYEQLVSRSLFFSFLFLLLATASRHQHVTERILLPSKNAKRTRLFACLEFSSRSVVDRDRDIA